MSNLPERINVMRVVSYDVQEIVNDLIEDGTEDGTVTLDDVYRVIEGLVVEDFGLNQSWASPRDLIWQDQDGEEL